MEPDTYRKCCIIQTVFRAKDLTEVRIMDNNIGIRLAVVISEQMFFDSKNLRAKRRSIILEFEKRKRVSHSAQLYVINDSAQHDRQTSAARKPVPVSSKP